MDHFSVSVAHKYRNGGRDQQKRRHILSTKKYNHKNLSLQQLECNSAQGLYTVKTN